MNGGLITAAMSDGNAAMIVAVFVMAWVAFRAPGALAVVALMLACFMLWVALTVTG